ncbi:MAG: uL30 family ribosomal protein [Candidatus Woesearchaeota archaeon]
MSKLAVILIRGRTGMKQDVKTTLDTFGLGRKHTCAIVDDSPALRGRLRKVQNFVTFGPVSDETIKLLNEKRDAHSKKGSVFFLAPPKGGFERKGIKVSYNNGGALGDRGEAMNDLVQKMI